MWVLPESVLKAINIIEKSGHKVYVVGGCVRDHLMGRTINDYDMTTSASTEELKELFKEYTLILAGEKHGTITPVIDGEPFEITTFRTDGEYSDGRHPEEVKFVTSFKEDAARRDFTMNSIGYNPAEGYVDHYGGVEDIKNGVIRCVGDAEKRFDEDALRIMRAVRFSSQLGYTLDEGTKKAAFVKADNLKKISGERVFEELKKTVMGKNCEEVLNEYMGILASVIPELSEMIGYDQQNYHHNLTLSAHTAKVVAGLPEDEVLRLAGLFHDIAKPACATVDENGVKHFKGHPAKGAEMAKAILTDLRCDNKTLEDVYTLIKEHDSDIPAEEKSVRRKLAKLGERLFFMLMDIKIADNLAQAPGFLRVDKFENIKDIAREIIKRGDCLSLKKLNIDGKDILSMGYSPSRKIGDCLERLLEKVIDGDIPNDREILLREAEEYMKTNQEA
ncbi:MAG: CCA tRNA nucleotidyltransferase [Eubacteriaceae bacterium]|nr:CCA tRNA nucleotidyltransferase [Eubacteriaceae bacterium]